MGSIKDIIGRIVNIFFSMEADIALKLLIGLILFLVVKLVVFAFCGLFKKRDVKSFLKDKTTLSSVLGGVLGLINAYIVGMILFILFTCCNSLDNANVSRAIFTLLPQIREIVEALRM